jgi:hypothetical protein
MCVIAAAFYGAVSTSAAIKNDADTIILDILEAFLGIWS